MLGRDLKRLVEPGRARVAPVEFPGAASARAGQQQVLVSAAVDGVEDRLRDALGFVGDDHQRAVVLGQVVERVFVAVETFEARAVVRREADGDAAVGRSDIGVVEFPAAEPVPVRVQRGKKLGAHLALDA